MAIREVAVPSPYVQVQAPITKLPEKITLLILSLLPGRQVSSMRRVCRHFSHQANREELWKFLLKQDFPNEMKPQEVSALLHYARCFRQGTDENWRRGQYVYQRLQCGPVFTVKGHQLICEGDEESVQVWDLREPSLTHTLERFPFDQSFIFSVIGDYLMGVSNINLESFSETQVWNRATGALLFEVLSLGLPIFDGTRLFIPKQTELDRCYGLASIEVWDSHTNQVTQLVSDLFSLFHLSPFFRFRLFGNYLCGTTQGFVKIWRKDTGAFIRAIGPSQSSEIGRDGQKMCIEMEGDKLICGYNAGTGNIKIWNIADGSLLRDLKDPENQISPVCTLKIDGDVIMAKCQDRTHRDCPEHIACWNKQTGAFRFKMPTPGALECLDGDRFIVVLEGSFEFRNKFTGVLLKTCQAGSERASIRIVKVDEHRIFSLSVEDYVLKIWDKQTGDILFVLKDVIDCKVIGNRMIIAYKNQSTDVCDFSFTPETPFALKGQLPQAAQKKRVRNEC